MDTSIKMDQEYELRKQKALPMMMWLGIGSIIMIFAGLTSAYTVRRGAGDWFSIVLPQIFWVSSAVILFSSVTMNISLQSFKANKIKQGTIFLAITLVLGLTFAFCQFSGWKELTHNGIYLVQAKGQTSLISGSFIYLLSGLHLAHMVGGIFALFFCLIKSLLGRYSAT